MRIILFLMLLGGIARNEQPVLLRFFFGYEWQTTLVVIIVSLFMLRVALGLAVSWGDLPKLRREMAALKRELSQKDKSDVPAALSY
jgi:lipopolysaccharide assembly protein A